MRKPNAPGVRMPRPPGGGLMRGLMAELMGYSRSWRGKPPEKKPPGAGRGGKHYGKVSSMGRMAESAAPAKRAKRDKPGGIK